MHRPDDNPCIKNLTQLKKELQRRVEQVLHDKFTWQTVENWVLEVLKERVTDIVMGALGYRWNDGHWELNGHNKEASIPGVVRQLARNLAEEHLPDILSRCKKEVEKKLQSPKRVREYVETYEQAVQDTLDRKIEEWVHENTQLAVDELFDRNCKGFLEEIKIKHKLTMQSLTILAGNEEEEVEEEEEEEEEED